MKKILVAFFLLAGISAAQAQGPSSCKVNASAPTTGGENSQLALSCDTSGNLRTSGGGGGGGGAITLSATPTTGTVWNSATTISSEQVIYSTGGPPFALVQLNQTTPISAGAVTFQGSFDGTNWVNVPAAQVFNAAVGACTLASNPYTLQSSINQPFLIETQGYRALKIVLTTPITGAGTVSPFFTTFNYLPFDPALCQPIVAGSNVIGKLGIDQSTPGTSNAVTIPGAMYETVAASATAQVLGGAGAAGDYLSHCVIYPITTGAGIVVVFDNTNAAGTNVIDFPTGTLSNLAPIPVPVGAISTAGPWKVTTGTNVKVTCYGKFTP